MRHVILAQAALALAIGFGSQAQVEQIASQTPAKQCDPARNKKLIAKNERSAIVILRTIATAEATYAATFGHGNFGTFKQLVKAKLLDKKLAETGTRHGYRFELPRVETDSRESVGYEAVAVPLKYCESGRRSFYLDESGVVRGGDKQGEKAHAGDEPIDEEEEFTDENF